MMKDSILRLGHLTPFARGSNRLCFVHPNDSTLCIKVLRPKKSAADKWRKKSNIRRYFRSITHYDDNFREFTEYQRLTKIGDDDIWQYVPRHYGFIDTDFGRGAVIRLIRNYDGTVAPTLREVTRRGEWPTEALEEFRIFLRKGYLANWNEPYENNLLCTTLETGQMRLYISDGLAQKEWFPVAAISSGFARRQAMRKAQKFERRLTRRYNAWRTLI